MASGEYDNSKDRVWVSPAFEQSKTALECAKTTDGRCRGVSVPRDIDFMAWQLATNDRGAGHRLFGLHPVRSKRNYSAIVCEEMNRQ